LDQTPSTSAYTTGPYKPHLSEQSRRDGRNRARAEPAERARRALRSRPAPAPACRA